jgi:hypothetical protein
VRTSARHQAVLVSDFLLLELLLSHLHRFQLANAFPSLEHAPGWTAFSNLMDQMQHPQNASPKHVLLRYVVRSLVCKGDAVAQAEAFSLQRAQHFNTEFVAPFETRCLDILALIQEVSYMFLSCKCFRG